jgi:hypothetical protein
MPAKSKKQFKKMFVLEREGKISGETRKEFTEGVDYKRLPNRKKKRKRRYSARAVHEGLAMAFRKKGK